MTTAELQLKTKGLAEKLNPKQKRFCELYASSEEFFGNGVKSYLEVYGRGKRKMTYQTAMVNASNSLRNPNIIDYVNSLLELRGLNDGFVDKQLEFLVTQHADFKSKLGAIHEYNQLKRRVDGGGAKILVVNITPEAANKYDVKPNPGPSNGSI